MGVHQGFVNPRIDNGRFIVKLEQTQLAPLAVDDPKVTHYTHQQLRLSRVNQVCELAFGKEAHFQLHFVKQMARKVKPKCRFFMGKTLFDPPRHLLHQIGFLGTGPLSIFAHHVKQPTLVGVGLGCRSKVKRTVYALQQGGAVELQAVHSAGFNKGFYGAFVQPRAVYPHAKVKQAGEGTSSVTLRASAPALARGHNGLNGLLACTFDGAQAIANLGVRHRLKAVLSPIDVGRLKAHAHLQGVFKQDLELIGVVHLHRHVGAEKLSRVMHLQPSRVIGQ